MINYEKELNIVLLIARGEAVRNFLYSNTLKLLSNNTKITVLSLIDHGEVIDYIKPYVDQIILLKEYRENRIVTEFRYLIHTAHFRWLWSENAKHMWELHNNRAKKTRQKIRRGFLRFFATILAQKKILGLITGIENWLSWWLRPTRDFDELFKQLKPDLIFNCSHIHGPQADLPMRVAHRMKIPTAVFIFSWDNLTTRSRIFVPYNYYVMWNEQMRNLLLKQYNHIPQSQVYVTGTPQFDFHFNKEFLLTREELCGKIGLDPNRPFILYSTGMDTDFLDEHKFIEEIIRLIMEGNLANKPQLVVRAYIKGTSPEIINLSKQKFPDVFFPPILWDKQWIMPLREDLTIYSSLLHHCAFGINAASTVTLELMALDKPVINIGMEPPGSNLPHWEKFSRHINYEHFRPIIDFGATLVARKIEDFQPMIQSCLIHPELLSEKRKSYMQIMMGNTLDGKSGSRVSEVLINLASLSTQ